MKYLIALWAHIAGLWILMIALIMLGSCGIDDEAVKAAMAKPSATPAPAKEEPKDKEPKDEAKNKAPEAAKPQAIAEATPQTLNAPVAPLAPQASPAPRQYKSGDTWTNPGNGDVWKNTYRGDLCTLPQAPTLKQVEDAVAAGYDNFGLRFIYLAVPGEPEFYWVYDLKTKTTNVDNWSATALVCVKPKL